MRHGLISLQLQYAPARAVELRKLTLIPVHLRRSLKLIAVRDLARVPSLPAAPASPQLSLPWEPFLMAFLITSLSSGQPSTTSYTLKIFLNLSWRERDLDFRRE